MLTGAGRGFCAGGDVTAMGGGANTALSLEQQVDRQRAIHHFSGLLHAMPKVSIAAINGACAGAGFGLALACDLRLAADAAKLTTAFAKVGFSGDFGITWPLVRTLGEARAKELLLLSDEFDAREGAAAGAAQPRAAGRRTDAGGDGAGRAHRQGPAGGLPLHEGKRARGGHRELPAVLDREGFTQRRTWRHAPTTRKAWPPSWKSAPRNSAGTDARGSRCASARSSLPCAELQHSAARLAALLGLDAPFRDPGVAEFGLDNAVFVFGDQFIEIVSPVQPGTTAGRLLDKRGDSGYMLILQTDDLKRERVRFAALGVRAVFDADHADISAVHLHPKDIGGAIVSVDEPRPAASWRWGGPDWRSQPGRRGAQRVLGLCLEALEPKAMAQRWAQVLALPQPVSKGNEGGGWRLALHEGWVDFVPAGARGEGIAGCTLAVADRQKLLDRADQMGVPRQGQSLTLLGTRIDLQALA